MAAPVETIDFDDVFEEITAKLKAEEERRLLPPRMRLFDGDMNLRGEIRQSISASFQFLENETGMGVVEMPIDYYLSKWLADVYGRSTQNVIIVVDKDGARWNGFMDELLIIKDDSGKKYVRVIFKHDYENFKNILCYSNPFLPPEVQFPRLWIVFGRARWSLKTTALVNIIRLESNAWTLPDDPLDPSQWFNFDQSTHTMVVKPDLTEDTSVGGIVYSRFKTLHEATKDVAADAQLTWELRRWLEGDPEPWPGANLRNGCLVVDLVDNSGWNTGTSFFGDIFAGLIHAFTDIGSDGITENHVTMPDPNVPAEYMQPGWKGSLPAWPGIVFRESEHTGIQSSEFSFKPATAVGVVAGGHSMPGVNEMIKAAVVFAGNLTASIPFLNLPPMGEVINAFAEPLYTDTILAYGKHKNIERAQKLGDFHLHEILASGSDNAYTLGWLLSMRTGMWSTRACTRHTLTVADGSPWRIGQNGHGHFFIGSRVGSTVLGMPAGQIFVDRVTELTLAWSREESPTWKIVVGAREAEDPVIKAFERIQELMAMIQDLGML